MSEKIKNYGLHKSSIEIQTPDIELTSKEKVNHYLGERYTDNYNKNIEGKEDVTDENGSKELISANTSTIFDKRKENTTKIDENENYDNEKKVIVNGFNPENTDSKFYTDVFKFNNSKAEVTNKNAVPVKYKKENGSGILSGRTVIVDLDKATEKENYIGASPWDGTNWDNSIRTNVDYQDDKLYDDIEELKDLGSLNFENSLKQLGNSLGAVKGAKNTLSKFGVDISKKDGDRVPVGTTTDNRFAKLQSIKSEKYKNIKMSSTIGTYNSLENLLGFASGLFVGSLGKSAVTNLLDDTTSKFAGGFGIVGIVERLSGAAETIPAIEDIIALNVANFYNMYTNKPGRQVSNRYNRNNFITQDRDKSLDGKEEKESIDNVLTKINKGINFVSNWADGSKISEAITNHKNKKHASNYDINGKCLIVSEKRDEKTLNFTRTVEKNKEEEVNIIFDEVFDDINEEEKIKLRKRFKKESDLKGNLLGGLYIEPYYCNEGGEDIVKCFTIPFEFNPKISDSGYEATYNTENLLGRILSVRSYIGTDSKSVSIETQYLALSDGETDSKNHTFDTQKWMKYWTVNKLLEIENEYRMLVLPYIKDDKFIRPPIVRIQLGYGKKSNLKVGDLFSYPNIDNALQVTSSLDEATKEKRYIVTSLSINPLDDGFWYHINYDAEITDDMADTKQTKNLANFYRGFKVNMTLVETTKNFLDVIPNYWHYMQATSLVDGTNNSKNSAKTTGTEDSAYGIYKIENFNINNVDKIENDLTSVFDIEEKTNKNDSLLVRIYKKRYGIEG